MQILLDRFDLFHAHLFIAADIGAGLLFHAAEYPALGPSFKFNLGFCQLDSPLEYSEAKMAWRNLVFIKARPSLAQSMQHLLCPFEPAVNACCFLNCRVDCLPLI